MAMMNFDQKLFLDTYNNLLSEKSFREVFFEVFIPLMEEIGFLWQAETISPAHEHFISYLIKLKIWVNTEKIQNNVPTKEDKIFVLYLPSDEVHELGLMYLNYEIILSGYKTIYLGESVPVDSLKDLKKYFNNIVYVCYTTVEPIKELLGSYLDEIKEHILEKDSKIWFIGRNAQNIDEKLRNETVRVFQNIHEFVNEI
jgi:hypothetical protein